MTFPRVLEPTASDPYQEANEYQDMDHSQVNQQFVDDLCRGPVGPQVIDLGCGPAAIPILLCHRLDNLQMLAIDAEIEMLEIAKREIDIACLLDRITLQHASAIEMPEYEDAMTDTLISNSLMHHLDDPAKGLQTAVRLLRPGGRLFIRDLYRPESREEVEKLVDLHTGGESEYATQLFRQSLFAALTLEEIQNLAGGFGINSDSVQMTSDRHWTIDWCRPVEASSP